ncbi:hypothetical protein [Corynebacterium glutamicum]|uniref:hypothetical protein n=1 Tax=Corynebacterium glutamicum TaxID=1718 RepID=UPI00058A62F3|nr:hypothetical protein [Corynebacterium glutamicum]AJE66411.1 hypothetical protein SB89_01900 [Corynebacterium glutamicum]OKX90065.1 hypothetical protein AUP72_09820 [Corynebacterium glutamicum]TWS33467.1 hypothetical protein AKJ21_12300 [Corynebacterium glutamicum]
MRSSLTKALAVLISGVLISPMSAGMAHAELSFGSSSFGSSGLSETRDKKAVEFKNALEEFFIATGRTKTDNAEAIANDYYQRAVNGELVFFEDMFFTDYIESERLYVVANSIPPERIEDEIAIIKQNTSFLNPDGEKDTGAIGVRVDFENGRYHSVQVYVG